MHHCLLQVNFTESHLAGVLQKCAAVFGYGHYAVDLFIVLSGFCLTIPLARADFAGPFRALEFFRKRVRRILPPYYFACALSLLLSWLLVGAGPVSQWSKTLVRNPWDIVTHLVLIQDVFSDTANRINYVLWSISIEWRIYFVFPLLVWTWRRMGGAVATGLAAGVSLLLALGLYRLRGIYPNLNMEPCGICPHFLLLFVMGMFAADIALSGSVLARRGRRLPWSFLLAVTALLIPLAPKFRVLVGRPIPWEVNDLCVGLFAVCVLVICAAPASASRLGWIQPVLAWRPLVFAGTFAYSIYLIHAPLIEAIWRYGLRNSPLSLPTAALAITVLGFPVILAVSYGFFWFCERPFLTRRKPAKPYLLPVSVSSGLAAD